MPDVWSSNEEIAAMWAEDPVLSWLLPLLTLPDYRQLTMLVGMRAAMVFEDIEDLRAFDARQLCVADVPNLQPKAASTTALLGTWSRRLLDLTWHARFDFDESSEREALLLQCQELREALTATLRKKYGVDARQSVQANNLLRDLFGLVAELDAGARSSNDVRVACAWMLHAAGVRALDAGCVRGVIDRDPTELKRLSDVIRKVVTRRSGH